MNNLKRMLVKLCSQTVHFHRDASYYCGGILADPPLYCQCLDEVVDVGRSSR